MAYMDNAKEVDTAVAASTPCMIYNSTPNGEFNEYYEKRKRAIKGELRYHRLHWRENPLYTEEWYKWKCRGQSPEWIARELEIQYVTSLEGRVYPEFNSQRTVESVDFDPTKPTFIAIDNSHGGKDPHAVIV
jgi:N-acetylmuramoyl-L-alanine amidase